MFKGRLCLSLLGWLLISPVALAKLDAMQLRLLESYHQALRWDNISDRISTFPMWVSGVKPVYDSKLEMHLVTLTPGAEVTFHLPAYQSIRLYSPLQNISADQINLSLSDGTGLAVKYDLYAAHDGHSLVLSPQNSKPLLVHIKPAVKVTQPLSVGLFVSRTEALDEIAPYRNVTPLSKDWVLLSTLPYDLLELYWQLPSNTPQTIKVTGTTRIALRHRLQFEPQARDLIQDYRIRYRLDGQAEQVLNLSTSVDSRYQMAVNFKPEVLSRSEEAYIEVPAGEHTLELSADRHLYLQVLTQTEYDYLLPQLNEPRMPVQTVRKQGLLATQPQSLQAAQSLRLAQDNSHKDSALLATQLLKQAALQRPDYPPLQQESEQLQGFRNFYRDLLPNHKASVQAQYPAYFISKRLQTALETQPQLVLAPQHLQAVLDRVGKTIFTPLAASGEKNANEYYLPDSAAATELRLLADKRYCSSTQRVLVQFDEAAPIAVTLRCEADVSLDAFEQTFFEVAVKDYQQQRVEALSCPQFSHLQTALSGLEPELCASLEQRREFYGLISQHFQDGELVDVADFELALPKKIKHLKIWQVSETTTPLRISVQYHSSKSFAFSEQSYLAHLKESNPTRLLKQFQQDLTASSGDNAQPAEQQLKNQWQGLKYLITSQARLYKAAVANPEPANPHKTTPERLASLYISARHAQTHQQWLEALEYWAKIVQHTDGVERQKAQVAQAEMLHSLGESYLAETLWRYLSLYAPDAAPVEIAEFASAKLRQQYQAQQDNFALQSLAASRVLKNPSREHLNFLISALLNNQEYHLALLLGLTMLDQPPSEPLLKAAYQLQWWETYQALVAKLPVKQQAFWQGLKAQAEGDYPVAVKLWEKDSPLWAKSVLTGLQLREKVANSCGKQQPENYQQWLNWQQQQPSEKQWLAATGYIKDYAGADSYYSPERDLYSSGFRGDEKRPITLALFGPSVLKLKVRPLHPAAQTESALDGWLEINDNQQHQLYPFTNNTPAQGLELISGKELQLGGLVELEYQVGAGWHQIQIFSQQAPVSVNVEEAQAQMPVQVLPRLQPYNFAATWQLPELPMLTMKNLELINPLRATYFPNGTQGSQPLIPVRQALKVAGHLTTEQQWGKSPAKLVIPELTAECVTTTADSVVAKLKKMPQTDSHAVTISAKKISIAEVLGLGEVANLEQAQIRMMQYLRLLETELKTNPPAVEKLLFPAEQLSLRYLDDPLLQSLWQRIARYTQWQDLPSVTANAGLRFVSIEGWQPESPFIRTRKALLPYIAKNEQIVFSDQRLVFLSKNLKPIVLHIDARLADVSFLPEVDAELLFTVDDKPAQLIKLKRQKNWQRVSINLPAGEHSLRFYQEKALGNQFIELRFDDHVSDLAIAQEYGYFLSTHTQPVQALMLGQARLRIDEWQNGASTTRYLEVAAGQQKISLPPASGKTESLLRLKQRRLVFEAEKINNRIIQRPLEKIPAPDVSVPEPKTITQARLNDAFKLGRQEDGTLSAGFDLVRRNNVQGGLTNTVPTQFAQYHLQYHFYEPYFKSYSELEAVARVHEFGDPGVGFNYSQLFLPSILPFSVGIEGKLMTQWVKNNMEWLGQVDVTASQSYQILPKTRLIPSVSMFARYLSLRNNQSVLNTPNFDQIVDQDVYSSYQSQHTNGLSTSLAVEHRPWLDTLWTGQVKLASNEGFNLFNLDHVSTEAHWKQLMGEVKLDATYRTIFYQVDKDRPQSNIRSQVSLELDWNRWLWHQQRFELSTKYTYDIQKRENLLMFSVTLHFSEGRGYRDFKPGSLDFEPIMQRQIPDEENNTIQYR